MCPDSSEKEDHKVFPVNNENEKECMDMWIKSQIDLGSLNSTLQGGKTRYVVSEAIL